MSDGWELPFSSVIDWSKAVIRIHEKAVLHIPVILRSIQMEQILLMRQQGYFLYAEYLSSIEKIVDTTLTVCRLKYLFLKAGFKYFSRCLSVGASQQPFVSSITVETRIKEPTFLGDSLLKDLIYFAFKIHLLGIEEV